MAFVKRIIHGVRPNENLAFRCAFLTHNKFFLPVSQHSSAKSSIHSQTQANERAFDDDGDGNRRALGLGFVSLLAGSAGAYWLYRNRKDNGFANTKRLLPLFEVTGKVHAAQLVPGQIKKGLQTYTKADVAKHNSKEKGIWVTYKNGVYDITEYATMHPGGKKIMMAAGKSIEPYWNLYSVHKNDQVYEIMESFRIGNIFEVEATQKELDASDPYKNDPQRSPILIPSSSKPFNAEPPVELLADQFITPNHLFFVRNHLPVPDIDEKTHTLDLNFGKKCKLLSVKELKAKFAKKTIACVTQCAGNRRSEMVKVKSVKGLNWGSAAISNAEWSGVTLNDLLKHQGVDIDTVKAGNIVFEGLDKQPDDSPYGASIPVELARMLKDDILVAYEMNGEPIPRDHGYPLRIVIPGVVGARQVKWLKTIYFSPEESTCHWQRRDYKGFNASIDWHNVDFDSSESISQLPVISAICEPTEGAELEEGVEEVSIKGYAWSGGGRAIIRVDVSADGGKTWHTAKLEPNGQSKYKSWAWTLWEADIPLPAGAKTTQLVAKAVDVSYNVQPDSVEGIWNLRGVLSNAWHRVNVKMASE